MMSEKGGGKGHPRTPSSYSLVMRVVTKGDANLDSVKKKNMVK